MKLESLIQSISFIMVGTLFLNACGTTSSILESSVQDSPSAQSDFTVLKSSPKTTIGKASWYGRRFHKRRTASGERFNMYDYTAAHRTLPFGSRLQVRNLKTGKAVFVRVNDRGPLSRTRLIDLSYAAGRELGILKSGLATVQIELLRR